MYVLFDIDISTLYGLSGKFYLLV